jgi:hypothetical protein
MLFHVVNIVNHRPQLHDTSIITAYIRRKVERTRACSGSSDTPVDVSSLSPVDRGLERTYWQDTGCKRVSGYEARFGVTSEAPVICEAAVPPTIPSFILQVLQCSYLIGSRVYSRGLTD